MYAENQKLQEQLKELGNAKQEPVKEEVEEEKVVEPEPQKVMKQQPTQVAQSNIDFTELVNEIKKLRETFEVALLSQKVLSADKEDEMKNAISVSNPQAEIPEHEAVILNTAEFYGDKKNLKKVIKSDEAAEREKFVEEKKAASSIGVGENEEDETPGEIRFLGKLVKGFGKLMWKILRKLFKLIFLEYKYQLSW